MATDMICSYQRGRKFYFPEYDLSDFYKVIGWS